MRKKVLALLLTLGMLLNLLAACGDKKVNGKSAPTPVPTLEPIQDLSFQPDTVLRMAVGYNSDQTGLFFDAQIAKDGTTLADGKTYHTGDLKPTWAEVSHRLGITFEDRYQGNSDSAEFEYWKEQLDEVDMVSAAASQAAAYGASGNLVDLTEYLYLMPNFKAFLNAHPIVRMSISDEAGGIYLSPYFDGVDDIERMPLMRTDWVQRLLDGPGEFTASHCDTTAPAVYEPYMPTSGTVSVEVVGLDGASVETIQKNYDAAGNIIATMNARGPISGVEAVNLLRKYIDEAYDGYYGEKRSDLFVGQNAAWDADELVALLRCVVANSATLNSDGEKVQGIFTREENNTQRRNDMYRLAGHLFGVRGLESRKDYLYLDSEGKFHDARQEPDTYKALDRMRDLAAEGLISTYFINSEGVWAKDYLSHDVGFMHYDYNQTQTIYNEDGRTFQESEWYMAVMPPVARWYDGTDPNGVYMRFTESWRSVKTGGWAISKAGVSGDVNKLKACLKLIDFAYTKKGMILLSYGPEAFRSDETFLFNGEEWPQISDACRAELWDKAGGNYTNYARYYLGSTLSFVKCQAFEYQCSTLVGRDGAGHISNAVALGTIKHPELAVTDNPWYTSVPTVLPILQIEADRLADLPKIATTGGDSKFGFSNNSQNVLTDIIASGYGELRNADSAARIVSDDWGGAEYLEIQDAAWQRALTLSRRF